MGIISSNEYKEPFESLYKLNIGISLDESETKEALSIIFNEREESKRISLLSALLNGIMIKGPTVNEVRGLLKAALELDNTFNKKLKINLPENDLIVGVASSGKKGLKTINITTVACFVAAACGVKIAKACSHSTSSKTGSSDFLDICGININIPLQHKVEILKKYNIAFFSIEDTTPKFAQLYGGLFYAPHAMSFALAGLSFPIEIDSLAYGLSHPNVKLSAEVLKSFGVKNSLTYSATIDGVHFLDELLPLGYVNFARIKEGHVQSIISSDIQETLGVGSRFELRSIKEKNNKTENIVESLKILNGNGNESQVNAICLNAAIFILLSNKACSLKDAYYIAKNKLKSKEVWNLFINVLENYYGNKDYINNLLQD